MKKKHYFTYFGSVQLSNLSGLMSVHWSVGTYKWNWICLWFCLALTKMYRLTKFLSEHNSHIVRDKTTTTTTVHDRRLSENCVAMVKHVMDKEGNILSFADLHERFLNVGLDFLTYHRLVSSIMTYQKNQIWEWEQYSPSWFRLKTVVSYFEMELKRSVFNSKWI